MIRFPAEWEPQQGILLTWPHSNSDWKDSLPQIEVVYKALVRHISSHEQVFIICYDSGHQTQIESLLSLSHEQSAMIQYYCIHSNDTWVRDYGPLCIYKDSKRQLLDYQFNGWGGKYNASTDNAVNDHLYEAGFCNDSHHQQLQYILEGGSIDSNGQGLLLTTTTCLLSATRNVNMEQADIERMLIQTLGIKQVLWLSKGYLIGDDTDSHVDNLARFVNKNTIVYCTCSNHNDPHYQALSEMEKELQEMVTCLNDTLNLIALPLPEAQYDNAGKRLPASYVNFLITNQSVLVPTFDCKSDQIVINIFQSLFKDRTIIGLDSRILIQQYGGIHCASMQIPSKINSSLTT